MRVAFFGSTAFSCLVLQRLINSSHEIVSVVTQPDQPAGRKMELCPTPVCLEAQERGLPVFMPQRLKSNPEFRRELSAYGPEAFIVASYGQILSRKVLALTEWPLNVHPSPLPKLRGASPVRTTLLQGLAATECCIMRMTPRMDDGDVMLRRPLTIPPDWNFEQLSRALAELGGELAVEALDHAEAGTATFTPQDHAEATTCSFYARADTVIDWSRPAQELYNFVRAWDPEVGAVTALPDGGKLKLWRVRLEQSPPVTPLPDPRPGGTVLAVTKKAVWVAAGVGTLRLLEVQPENRARMPVESFLAGRKLEPGDRLGTTSGTDIQPCGELRE